MNFDTLIETAHFRPLRLEASDPWVGHTPFAAWLIQSIKPQVFVELGTFAGNSYLAFCQAVKEGRLTTRCYAVDTWEGDIHGGYYGEDIFQKLNDYHQDHYSSFSRLMRMTFDQAVTYFDDGSIELLHIDGLHTYEAVKHDFSTWLPKLAPHAVVIFHDTNVRERDFGIWRFWQEICQQYPLNFEFSHSHGLGVLQLTRGKGDFYLEWLDLDFPQRQMIEEYFAGLGQHALDQFHRQQSERSLAELEPELNRVKALLSDDEQMIHAKEQSIQTLEAQLVEKEQSINTLEARLAEQEEQANRFNIQVTKLEQQLTKEEIQRNRILQELTDLKEHLQQREQILNDINSKLLEIYSSTAWKIVQSMWKVRLWLAPTGSGREKFGRSLIGLLKKPVSPVGSENGEPILASVSLRKRLDEQYWVVMATQHTLYVAYLIAERLQAHGCKVKITTVAPADFSSDYYVVICPQMFSTLPPGEKRISFQMEQSVSSRWFTEDYLKILKESLAVVDYSLHNIGFLDSQGIVFPQVYYLPIGCSLTYNNQGSESEKIYDVLFYGDEKSSPRRLEMLNALQAEFNLKICSEVFGLDLINSIKQAKFVINLHYYENALLEMPRIQECLSLGVPVISETSQDQDDYPELVGAVRFFEQGSISGMIETVRAALREGLSSEQIDAAAQASARRFGFMFDRLLMGMDLLPSSYIKNVPMPSLTDHIILSLPETIARRRICQSTCPQEYSVFDGIRRSPGWIGCGLSYSVLASQALESQKKRLIIMEDDVMLPEDFQEKLKIIMEYLDTHNDEWDIFAGIIAALHPDTKILNVETYRGIRFVTIDKMTSMVFNVYREKALRLLASWNPENLDVVGNTIDRYLERQTDLRVVVCLPFLVGHREEETSTIWGFKNVQYKNMFNDSQKELEAKIWAYEVIDSKK